VNSNAGRADSKSLPPRQARGSVGAASGVGRVTSLQRTAGNRATAALLMRENGDGDAPVGGTTQPRKDALDDEIMRLLDGAIAAVGAPGAADSTVVKWAERVVRHLNTNEENKRKLRSYKSNQVTVYVKTKGYELGYFAKETRATLDPAAISNPDFTSEEKRQIVSFLKTSNRGSPTVRVDEAITTGEWSIKLHYDLLGPAHGGANTPHVQFLKGDTKKGGVRYVGDHTRAMTFEETKALMSAPTGHPSWAVEWAKQQAGAS
jgi:hypothetical protein